jgi:hypothetical protein
MTEDYEMIKNPSQLAEHSFDEINTLYSEHQFPQKTTKFQMIAHLIGLFPADRITFDDLSKIELSGLKEIAIELGVSDRGDKMDVVPRIVDSIGGERKVIERKYSTETVSTNGKGGKEKTIKESSYTVSVDKGYSPKSGKKTSSEKFSFKAQDLGGSVQNYDNTVADYPEYTHYGNSGHTTEKSHIVETKTYEHTSDYVHDMSPSHRTDSHVLHHVTETDSELKVDLESILDKLKLKTSRTSTGGIKRRRPDEDEEDLEKNKKRKLILTRSEFEEKAEPLEFYLESNVYEAVPKIFEGDTGTFGWYASGQEEIFVDGKAIKVQYNLNLTAY